MDSIHRPHMLPFLAAHADLHTFQHDGARPYAARFTRDFLHYEDIRVMRWVPYSPDFNPIEQYGMNCVAGCTEESLKQEWN